VRAHPSQKLEDKMSDYLDPTTTEGYDGGHHDSYDEYYDDEANALIVQVGDEQVIAVDEDGDGDVDVFLAEVDGEIQVEEVGDDQRVVAVDLDGDRFADVFKLDENGDGNFELVAKDEFGGQALDTQFLDVDEDGRPDVVQVDFDEDGVFESSTEDTADGVVSSPYART
jgi:hypothetical protein